MRAAAVAITAALVAMAVAAAQTLALLAAERRHRAETACLQGEIARLQRHERATAVLRQMLSAHDGGPPSPAPAAPREVPLDGSAALPPSSSVSPPPDPALDRPAEEGADELDREGQVDELDSDVQTLRRTYLSLRSQDPELEESLREEVREARDRVTRLRRSGSGSARLRDLEGQLNSLLEP